MWLAASVWISCSGSPAVESVPIDVERISVIATCVEIEDGDRVASVGPEGQLWLARAAGTGRIFDLDGSFFESLLPLSDVTSAQAWDAGTLSLVEAGELWTQIGETRQHIPVPDELGAIDQFCGDPSTDRGTFVASASGLFERTIGFWWQWRPQSGDSFGAIRQLARVDGACTDDRDVLWLLNDAGQLWQIGADDARVVGGQSEPIDQVAVARSIGVVTMSQGALAIGPSPWTDVHFAAGDVSAIAAGSEAVWAVAGGSIYVRTTEGWRQVDSGDPTTPTALHAHAAGGAWLEYADRLCHVALAEPLRVAGLRPFERRLLSTASIDVTTGDSEIALALDDASIASAATDDGVARFVDVDLGGAGWHTVRLSGADSNASRELDVFVIDVPQVSWESEIAPVFSQFCAGAFCHGPSPEGARVDLSTFEAWQARAPLIRTRLLRGEMPPIDPRPPTDSIDLVLDWIQGGMKP
jgi:hypothetical protein